MLHRRSDPETGNPPALTQLPSRFALSTTGSSSCNSTEKRCENVAGAADSMKKLGGCSVTPSSAAKFDWSVGIFATTVTQSGLAANAAAKQVNCQNLMPPAPQIFFFLQGSTLLAFFFVAQRVSVLTGAIFAEVCGISATIPKRAYSAARRRRQHRNSAAAPNTPAIRP